MYILQNKCNIHLREFYQIFEQHFLNLFHEYRNVNSILKWEKTCSAAFSCRDLDTADGLPVLNGTAVVNATCSIKLGVIQNRCHCIKRGHSHKLYIPQRYIV